MRTISLFCLALCLLVVQIPVGAQLRIINGERSKSNAWPWMAAILYTSRSSVKDGQFCGATLVHPSWVLTAAHCTLGETTRSIEVVLGRQTLSDNNRGEIIGIKQILVHEDYDKHPDNPLADLALLELEKPSKQPVVKIAESYSLLTQVGTETTVIGWGQTDAYRRDSYADSLRHANVPIASNEVCNDAYDGDVQDSMLCAGFKDGGTDACVGDSGGPLVVDSYAGAQQIGIVSWGEKCALPNYYGVYTRMPSYQTFVSEKVCETDDIPAIPELDVKVDDENLIISWEKVKGADGYQFYSAPYSNPLTDVTLNNINSIDLGEDTNLTLSLEVFRLIVRQDLYVAVRAYQGNCYSSYSNLGTILVEE
jgi:secreted trypsin-like serine protease